MSLWQVMLCALALCLAGMLVLSQAMDRHCDQLVSRGEPGPALRVVLRLAGAALMLLALRHCMDCWGGAVGIVVWLGCLSVAALAVAWLLAYMPRQGAVFAAMGGLGALAWTILADPMR
ncbi:DUF3325 domain-containing protein [Comamonas thiooxydans]|uniref:DUF3325 domain-containing protein n=1 Tax=Comamonas thiooxydans TaxID=363952 RepID=UPI000A2DCB4F|nr:DUF3325 domain-containing protein [Comamonas thiooxydans]BDR08803.1 DUF3325 domain-containing protein [Comamonas thiooxydans]